MGYRFHRSIKIAKGIRLNVSKSGLGLSVGPRGAKLSVNSKGVYSNLGIPGTGLSQRQKIADWGNSSKLSNKTLQNTFSGIEYNVHIEVNQETGEESIIVSHAGREITDNSIIKKIKQSGTFKDSLQNERENLLKEIQFKSEVLTSISKESIELPNWELMRAELLSSKPQTYQKVPFIVSCPQKEDMRSELVQEAVNKVKAVFFKKKRIYAYVDAKLEDRYQKKINEWESERLKYEKEQNRIEQEKNKTLLNDYNRWKSGMIEILAPSQDFIETRLTELFSQISLPLDFSISFNVKDDGNLVMLDIDLPEIEDFPTKKAKQLTNGKISIKEKSEKERNQDYLQSVTGLSFFFSSVVFSASPKIEKVIISGFTQRINKATGNIEDDYIYSVDFPIAEFRELNLANIDPSVAIQQFDHRIDILKDFKLRTISPF
ncbi:DUF4236 domain-containing protein [uncultured Sphaerochaeta sp.]|uniref:DUF4236 domain-containing protein n=1 Tax=uncultured Sphaerochaeta sp. TaxID=886478 RepID=UPI002A0A68C9|nr:DUF4236 domain-containing protein [uncultured Sphaerochaeta sp.]